MGSDQNHLNSEPPHPSQYPQVVTQKPIHLVGSIKLQTPICCHCPIFHKNWRDSTRFAQNHKSSSPIHVSQYPPNSHTQTNPFGWLDQIAYPNLIPASQFPQKVEGFNQKCSESHGLFSPLYLWTIQRLSTPKLPFLLANCLPRSTSSIAAILISLSLHQFCSNQATFLPELQPYTPSQISEKICLNLCRYSCSKSPNNAPNQYIIDAKSCHQIPLSNGWSVHNIHSHWLQIYKAARQPPLKTSSQSLTAHLPL